LDRNGLLKDITTLLSNEKVNVLAVHTQTNTKNQSATMDLIIEVHNHAESITLQAKLKNLQDVSEVRRL